MSVDREIVLETAREMDKQKHAYQEKLQTLPTESAEYKTLELAIRKIESDIEKLLQSAVQEDVEPEPEIGPEEPAPATKRETLSTVKVAKGIGLVLCGCCLALIIVGIYSRAKAEPVPQVPASVSESTPSREPSAASEPQPEAQKVPAESSTASAEPSQAETLETEPVFSETRTWEESENGLTLYCAAYTRRDETGVFEVINRFTDPDHSTFYSLFESYVVDGELNDFTGNAVGIWPSTENPGNDHDKAYDFFVGSFLNNSMHSGTMTVYTGLEIRRPTDGPIRYADITGKAETGFAQTITAPDVVNRGPFALASMPDIPPNGYYFVLDYYYIADPSTGYRYLSYQKPDLEYDQISGNWYLDDNRELSIKSIALYKAEHENNGKQCVIYDEVGLGLDS